MRQTLNNNTDKVLVEMMREKNVNTCAFPITRQDSLTTGCTIIKLYFEFERTNNTPNAICTHMSIYYIILIGDWLRVIRFE